MDKTLIKLSKIHLNDRIRWDNDFVLYKFQMRGLQWVGSNAEEFKEDCNEKWDGTHLLTR